MSDPTEEAGPPLNIATLEDPNMLLVLGAMVATSLQTNGAAGVLVDEDGDVRIANPVHVYFDVAAFPEIGEELPEFRWVRPIVGEAKPQYSAWRDGQLWEIEIVTQ